MTSKYNLKNFASGDEYYKSIDYGLNKEIYIDSLVLPDLYKYNLAVQNYYLGTPILKKKVITYVKDKNDKKMKKKKE
jgi:hypothetical protein